ncbi:MAG: 3-hydroxyacyl-ACP dehydratase FabZ [Oscillospiraceae bacterium]
MELNCNEIEEILPHRYPFLLVDKITDFEAGKWAKGIKCVSANEAFFCGHFPKNKIMPGVLIVEALAQVGAIAILTAPQNKGRLAVFGRIKNCRFKEIVTPGDVLELNCELIKIHGLVGIGKAIATVNGKIAVTAELTFALK